MSHKEGCAGIEEYGIAFRTPYPAAKDIARNPGIFFRRPAKEVFLRAGHKAKILGTNEGRAIIAIPDFTDDGRAILGDISSSFSLPYATMPRLTPRLARTLAIGSTRVFIINTEKEHFRLCRVRKGAQDIEDRAESQFLTDGAYIFHGTMIFLGKEKAEVRLLQHGKGLFRRHVNLDTQGLKAIGCAAQRRSSPIAVFCYFHAACSKNHG